MIENSFFEQKNIPKIIETIKGPFEGEASICSFRGITYSVKLKGKEIIFLDEETFKDKNANVRGGIPILFPNSGPLNENSLYPELEQHGFARKMEWKIEKTINGFKATLSSSEETKKIYPYDFRFSMTGSFEQDGSFTLGQEIENKEEDKEMPISMGLHPYFKVPNDEKKNIKFDFEGGDQAENQIEKWANGEYISIDNPKLKDPNAVIRMIVPSLGALIIDPSIEYEKIWVWSTPGKDYFCVEPVMRDVNGLIDNPKNVEPKETFKLRVNFKLE